MAMVAGAGDHRRDNDRLAYDWRLLFGLGTESSHDSLLEEAGFELSVPPERKAALDRVRRPSVTRR
jgi:hypothetical protein